MPETVPSWPTITLATSARRRVMAAWASAAGAAGGAGGGVRRAVAGRRWTGRSREASWRGGGRRTWGRRRGCGRRGPEGDGDDVVELTGQGGEGGVVGDRRVEQRGVEAQSRSRAVRSATVATTAVGSAPAGSPKAAARRRRAERRSDAAARSRAPACSSSPPTARVSSEPGDHHGRVLRAPACRGAGPGRGSRRRRRRAAAAARGRHRSGGTGPPSPTAGARSRRPPPPGCRAGCPAPGTARAAHSPALSAWSSSLVGEERARCPTEISRPDPIDSTTTHGPAAVGEAGRLARGGPRTCRTAPMTRQLAQLGEPGGQLGVAPAAVDGDLVVERAGGADLGRRGERRVRVGDDQRVPCRDPRLHVGGLVLGDEVLEEHRHLGCGSRAARR